MPVSVDDEFDTQTSSLWEFTMVTLQEKFWYES